MAASQAHPSAPSLADLPDELLVACFAQLEDPLERCAAPIARCTALRGAGPQPPPLNPPARPHLQAPRAATCVPPLAAPC